MVGLSMFSLLLNVRKRRCARAALSRGVVFLKPSRHLKLKLRLMFVLFFNCNIIRGSYFSEKIYFFNFLVSWSGLLIFCAVADLWNSGISVKSRKIPKKTRNTGKSTRNISKYMAAKRILYLSWLLDLYYSPQRSKFILKLRHCNE